MRRILTSTLGKLNCFGIISGHFATLHQAKSKKINWLEALFHAGIPLGLGVLAYTGVLNAPNKDDLVVVATVLSIFAALLFTLLVMLLDRAEKKASIAVSEANVRDLVIKELHENVSYAILVALICLVFLVLKSLNVASLDKAEKAHQVIGAFGHWWSNILNAGIFCLSGAFLLTIFMVLKRTHELFKFDLSN